MSNQVKITKASIVELIKDILEREGFIIESINHTYAQIEVRDETYKEDCYCISVAHRKN